MEAKAWFYRSCNSINIFPQSRKYCSHLSISQSKIIVQWYHLSVLFPCFHELSVHVDICTALNMYSPWYINFFLTSLFIDSIGCDFYIGNCVYLVEKNPKERSRITQRLPSNASALARRSKRQPVSLWSHKTRCIHAVLATLGLDHKEPMNVNLWDHIQSFGSLCCFPWRGLQHLRALWWQQY